MINKIKIEKVVLVGIVICAALAFGLSSGIIEFLRYFVLSGVAYSALVYYNNQRKNKDKRVEELENLLEQKKIDERVVILEKMLEESDGVILEQEEVIKNYEELLDTASIKFPCNCGNNMFDGIFKPLEEVVVQCDYCDAKYALTLKLDSVLITEPIEDLNIDELIKNKEK
jgi:hypothetical protein